MSLIRAARVLTDNIYSSISIGGGVEVFLRGPLDPLVRMERYLHNVPEAEA